MNEIDEMIEILENDLYVVSDPDDAREIIREIDELAMLKIKIEAQEDE